MKKFKTILAAVLVMALVMAAVPAFADSPKSAEPAEVSGSTFYNDYITFTVGNYARVSRYMTMENGSAADELLYGSYGSYGGSSFTTVRINGASYLYGTNGSSMTTTPAFRGNTNYSADTYSDVLVEQRLTPVMNDAGHESLIEWRYTYTNNSDSAKTVGCRIMLDTCLGTYSGDGAPYRVPGVDSITTEQTYTGTDIPSYWFTFYNDIVAQGSFADNNMPDQFQIASWSGVYNTVWDYSTGSSYTMSDTSASATWYEETLNPGETREYVMYYGIGEVAQQQVGELMLTLNGNHSVALNDTEDGYEPNPVSLMGILQNVGNGGLEGVYANVVLPEGLSFANGSEAAFNVGALAAGAEAQETWYISIDETSTEDRTFVIEVHYGCDGTEDAVAYWELFVPGIPAVETVPPTIEGVRAELRNRQPNDAKVDLRFIFNVTFNDSYVTYGGVNYGPADAYRVTGFYSMLSAMGNSVRVAGTNIFEMYNGNFTFTAVLKNLRPANYDKDVTAIGYLEYMNTASGEMGYDNTEDQPMTYCVNDLLG